MEISFDAMLQHLLVFVVAAFVGSAISWIAFKEGFFQLPPMAIRGPILNWQAVFGAFGLFLAIELVLVPTLYLLWLSWEQGEIVFPEKVHLSAQAQVWINMLAIICTAVALTIYYRSFDPSLRKQIWGRSKPPSDPVYNWLVGAFSWFIIYPWIMTVSQLIGILMLFTNITPHVDQVAVKHVKEAMSYPLQLWIMVVAVVIVVPILEELLFRGFLQTWLKGLLGRAKAIVIVSIVFALFHFSTTQGAENIELLAALFLLSCFLGFIRERQDSLWASMGLHSTFNLVSISIILKTAL